MLIDTKTFAAAAAAVLFTVASPASAATLLQYNFADNGGITVSEAPSFVATNLTGNALVRGSGLTAASATDGFNSQGWGAYATNANDFLSFGFSVADGFTASVNQLTFGTRSSGTGPRDLAVLASIDSGAFALVGAFTLGGTNDVSQNLAFTPLTALESVVFRIVATSNTSVNGGTIAGAGTFRVQNSGNPDSAANPFSINGDVTALPVGVVPEPAAWAMMIGGFGLVGGTLRRRQRTTVTFA